MSLVNGCRLYNEGISASCLIKLRVDTILFDPVQSGEISSILRVRTMLSYMSAIFPASGKNPRHATDSEIGAQISILDLFKIQSPDVISKQFADAITEKIHTLADPAAAIIGLCEILVKDGLHQRHPTAMMVTVWRRVFEHLDPALQCAIVSTNQEIIMRFDLLRDLGSFFSPQHELLTVELESAGLLPGGK